MGYKMERNTSENGARRGAVRRGAWIRASGQAERRPGSAYIRREANVSF